MTMPKFEPVARLISVALSDRNLVWARTFEEYSSKSSESNPYRNGDELPLYTAEQLRQAYELGLKGETL